MITFYPGPSKIHPEIATYLSDAFHSGLLATNHRSEPFMALLSDAIQLLKEKLGIPESYEIVLTSSATECWEIVAQSLSSGKSYHIYNGAFGHKWKDYAHRIHGNSIGVFYTLDEEPTAENLDHNTDDMLCITHTETSNGSAISDAAMKRIRAQFNGLVAVDATASMAGVPFRWETGDVWFASVQKCFGLPSGLAVMVLSPAAIERAKQLGENKHYNSLLFVIDNFRKNQTPYTPNILGIYLLKRRLEASRPIASTGKTLETRSRRLYTFLEEHNFPLLITEPTCRAATVIAVQGSAVDIAKLKSFAKEKGIVLGNGYGDWKETTIRIANFPAITDGEFDELKQCLLAFRQHR